LLASAEEYESVLLQRLQDLEGHKVSAQLGGYRMEPEEEPPSKCVVNLPGEEDSRRSETQTLTVEYDDDLENLDEYGEYH
jgi:hypothetical protein